MADDKHYSKAVVRLSELVDVDGILDGFTFEGCQINGPAVVLLADSTVANNNLGGPNANALLWPVDPVARPVIVGAILAKRCTFDGCTFANVGFTGPPDLMAALGG